MGPDIESAFYHTWDYLTLCVRNCIVISKGKFQFLLRRKYELKEKPVYKLWHKQLKKL